MNPREPESMEQGGILGHSFKVILDSLYDGVYVLDAAGRITYWNPAAERITGFKAADVLGRRCSDQILMHVDQSGNPLCGERCPAQCCIRDGQAREHNLFLHNRLGHRVGVSTRISVLRNGSGEILGAVEIFSDNSRFQELTCENERLRDLALIDDLTQVGNRRFGEDRLREILNEYSRYSWPFAVLFIDVDQFKEFNDSYGHEAGDQVLRMVAQTLRHSLRSFDCVCRWGGEEFLCIVKNTGSANVGTVAEKLRNLVQRSSAEIAGRSLTVTVSVGVAVAKSGDTVNSLVTRADRAMYLSKEGGRNRITLLP